MAKQSFSKDLIATVLVESLYSSDETACARYGISTRTLHRYRKSLTDDLELADYVATKKAILDANWGEDFPIVLRKGARLISECWDEIQKDSEKKKDPQVIAAIAGAMKLAADIHLTGRVIDARIADTDRQANGIPRQASAEAEAYPN